LDFEGFEGASAYKSACVEEANVAKTELNGGVVLKVQKYRERKGEFRV